MIRKHNRRAAKAAFAIALGVAIILGGAVAAATAGETRTQATPLIIGTKNFPEQYILGQLYKQALEAKGFKVAGYKENIGSTELADTALMSGKITMYPEYVGVILSVTFGRKTSPKTSAATYALANRLYAAKGFALARQTPFEDKDVLAVLNKTATQYGLRSIGDLKKVPNLSIAGFPEFKTRRTGQLATLYGVKGFKFVPLASISAYELLDKGQVLSADVFTTDPQLGTNKYTQLKDPKNMFGFQHVAPVYNKKLATELGPKFVATLNAVSAKLTTKAMIAMNTAVIVNKKSPKAVAAAFLKANGLT
jgi:osmoprotectant transport system substrate-binding protein